MNTSRAVFQSARGLAQSKTWRTVQRPDRRETSWCGSPLFASLPSRVLESGWDSATKTNAKQSAEPRKRPAKSLKMNPDEKQFFRNRAG